MSKVLLLLGILAGTYAIYVAVMASQQSHLVFAGQGMPMTVDLRDDFPLASYVELRTSEGPVHACYIESDTEFRDGPIALVAHGNAETIGHWSENAKHLTSTGLSVFLVEYPGYAGSSGRPNRKSIDEAFTQAYQWLQAHRNAQDRQVIGVGRTLGAGPITHLATRERLDGIILLAPFSSLKRMAWGLGLPPFLLRTRYDNVDSLSKFEGPTLVLHGVHDRIIPIHHSRTLAKANDAVTLKELTMGHKDLLLSKAPRIEDAKNLLASHIGPWMKTHGFMKAEAN